MQLQIISDVHVDIAGSFELPQAADYLVVAGDFGNGTKYAKKLLTRWAKQWKKIFFVLGNHDYYCNGDVLAQEIDLRLWLQRLPNCIWLNDDVYEDEEHGVLLYGGTMWTKFWDSPISAEIARTGMNDFRYIKFDERNLLPSDVVDWHERFRKGLRNCQALYGTPDIVVSHHGPSSLSITEGYHADPLNPAYIEQMGDVLCSKTTWIHGHTHNRCEFIAPDLHDSRVINWSRGYEKGSVPDKVITV